MKHERYPLGTELVRLTPNLLEPKTGFRGMLHRLAKTFSTIPQPITGLPHLSLVRQLKAHGEIPTDLILDTAVNNNTNRPVATIHHISRLEELGILERRKV